MYDFSYDNDHYRPLSPFTGEATFTHATQDEDHGSRKAGHGAKGKRRRKTMGNLADDFGSMSIITEQSSVGYNALMESNFGNWTDDRYGEYNYGASYSSGQYPSDYSHEQQTFHDDQSAQPQVNYGHFPHLENLLVASTTYYYAHLHNYVNNYRNTMTWHEYCCYIQPIDGSQVNTFEPPRNSMWY